MSQHDAPRRIPVTAVDEPASTGIRRRAALQTLLGTAAAGFALPAIVDAQHPMHAHLGSPGTVERAQEKAASSSYAPQFLDAHQLKALDSLSEAIVPGSTAARVAPFLDLLLAVEAPQNQSAFLGALGAFDMAAINKHGKAWTALAAQGQDALLRDASTAPAKSPMAAHFQNLKDWIAGAYYSSEPGMRELGWDGNVIHQELPRCTHPGGHQA